MKKLLNFFFTLSILTASAQKTIINDSINIDGNYRKFSFVLPINDTKNFSLVFVMHGSGGNGLEMMERAKSLINVSEEQKFIAVFPDGYKKFWNECRKSSPAESNHLNINEEKFFLEMISYFQNKYKINRKKVFAIGTSGGGHMAYKLAMTIPYAFKGVTAIIANLPDSSNMDCVPTNLPVNILIVNGTDDKTNPYHGGEVILGSGNFGRVMSTDRSFAYWSHLAGYTGNPAFEKLPDTNPNDNKTIERYSFDNRRKKVELLKVIGGKHDYPGDIDVHIYAWSFFKDILAKK